ncbi:MAG: InlB B-repeat-containing protein [Clostridia bacterium]|nr:InlB B-repeat-containing protein [Clostridia bacterium]
MSYMEESCCCPQESCAFSYGGGKGRNVSRFVEIVIGALVCFGIFAVIVMIGGCLGCEACFECAAACDEEMGCGLEDCARDCNEQSDDCVSCEGISCFGREGCFACDGKWDCSDCAGEVYYKVTLNTGDESTTLKMKEGTKKISIDPYNEDKPADFYTFKGYYNKEIGGTQYIDENGNIVKDIGDDIKLYAQYKELGAGEEFLLIFNTVNPETGEDYFVPEYADDYVYVGEGYNNFPSEAQLENYVFKGWYTQPNGGGKLIWGPDTTEYTLHLSDFNKRYNSDSTDKRLNVYAHYELEQFTVYLHILDDVQEERAYSGTLFSEFIANHPYENSAYTFFGWSEYENAGITDTIADDTIIQDDLHVYAIVRKNYTFTFKYRETTSGTNYEEKEIKLVRYQGQTIDLDQSESDPLLAFLWTTENEHLYKGYKFTGWAKSTSTNATTLSSIEVNEYAATTYYAKYTERPYKIEYYVYESGQYVQYTQEALGTGANINYTYGEGTVALWDCSNWFPGFLGWSETPNGRDTMKLESYEYGDKKLYAVFG